MTAASHCCCIYHTGIIVRIDQTNIIIQRIIYNLQSRPQWKDLIGDCLANSLKHQNALHTRLPAFHYQPIQSQQIFAIPPATSASYTASARRKNSRLGSIPCRPAIQPSSNRSRHTVCTPCTPERFDRRALATPAVPFERSVVPNDEANASSGLVRERDVALSAETGWMSQGHRACRWNSAVPGYVCEGV